MTRRATVVVLWLILAGALAVRVAWGLMQPASDDAIDRLPDQREYLQLARSLLRGEGLKFVDPRFDSTVYAYRTPGYPILVAACGANVRAVRVVQAIIDTSTVFAIFLFARRWSSGSGDAGVAPTRRQIFFPLLAAFLVAINPFLIYFSATILSETLFTALLAWGMVCLVLRFRFHVLAAGLIFGFAVLVRPSALFLPVLLGFLSHFTNRSEPRTYHPRRLSLPVGATMLAITFLVLLPWAYRNRHVLGQWIWTTTNSGITTYDGFNPSATGASDQRFVQSMPELRTMSEVERSRYLGEKAMRFVRENPRRVVELTVAKILRTWSPMPLSSEYSQPKYQLVGLLFSVPFDLLILVGICWGPLPRAAKALLLAPALYFTLVHALSVGSLRYRIPVEAPMSVIAASCAALRRREGPV